MHTAGPRAALLLDVERPGAADPARVAPVHQRAEPAARPVRRGAAGPEAPEGLHPGAAPHLRAPRQPREAHGPVARAGRPGAEQREVAGPAPDRAARVAA